MEEVIDSTLDNATGNQDGQVDENGNPISKVAEPAPIDWENEANPYRKRYGDSQGQIQPLVRTLSQFAEYDHNTKQWKPKTQVAAAPVVQGDADLEKLLSGYDPEFVKALGGYISPIKTELAELRKARQEAVFFTEYNSQVGEARNKAITEFGDEFEFSKDGKFNTESPLYKLANEILATKYARFEPDGKTFHSYSTPDAEYLSTMEAYAIMAKRAKQPQPDKGRFSAIQGKGSKAAGVKRVLAYEEYNKLTNEQKDAYDLSQAG